MYTQHNNSGKFLHYNLIMFKTLRLRKKCFGNNCSATFVHNTVCSNKYSCSQDVRRNMCRSTTTMSNFTKIHLAVSELLHEDRQRARHGTLIDVFLQLSIVKKPKITHVSEKQSYLSQQPQLCLIYFSSLVRYFLILHQYNML
jgi:hypothetical protein